MTQIIGELSIADPINLVIGPVVSFGLVVSTPVPVALAVTPPAAQVIVTAGQGPGGPQGIQGPAGVPGPPGVGSISDVVSFERLLTSGGAQDLTLPSSATSFYRTLTINGLRQSRSAYSITATTLHLPADLYLLTGDLVALDYA